MDRLFLWRDRTTFLFFCARPPNSQAGCQVRPGAGDRSGRLGFCSAPQLRQISAAGCDRACYLIIRFCSPISALGSVATIRVCCGGMCQVYHGRGLFSKAARQTSSSTTIIKSLQPTLSTASYLSTRWPTKGSITFSSFSSRCHQHSEFSSKPSRRIRNCRFARLTNCERLSKPWRTVVETGKEPHPTAASAPTARRTSPVSSAPGWLRRACPRPQLLWGLRPMSSRAIVHWGPTALLVSSKKLDLVF